MYYRLNNQKEVMERAILKAGSLRKLSAQINIHDASLWRYLHGAAIMESRLKIILKFLNIKLSNKLINQTLEENFRQKIGGRRCVEVKKDNGTFERDMILIRKKSSQKLKEWHKKMKEEFPEEYYSLQYSRFKKIAGYKCKTKNGEKVRNSFEKKVADFLFNLGISYEYEPLVNINKKYFFPDFLINGNIILECTEWKGHDKAIKLNKKINYLEKRFKVFVVIPRSLSTYYQKIEKSKLIYYEELTLKFKNGIIVN